jgi:hypothetical protein
MWVQSNHTNPEKKGDFFSAVVNDEKRHDSGRLREMPSEEDSSCYC